MYRVIFSIVLAILLGPTCGTRVTDLQVIRRLSEEISSESDMLSPNWAGGHRAELIGFDDKDPEPGFRTLTFTKVVRSDGGEESQKKISVAIVPQTEYPSLKKVEEALLSGTSKINEYLKFYYLMYNDNGKYFLFWNIATSANDATDTVNYFNDLFERAELMSDADKQELDKIKSTFITNEAQFQKWLREGKSKAAAKAKLRALQRKHGAELQQITDAYKQHELALADHNAAGMQEAKRTAIFRNALRSFRVTLDEFGGGWERIKKIDGIAADSWDQKKTRSGVNVRDLVGEEHFQDIVEKLHNGDSWANIFKTSVFILVDDLHGTGGHSCDPTCYLIWKKPRETDFHASPATKELVAEVRNLIGTSE